MISKREALIILSSCLFFRTFPLFSSLKQRQPRRQANTMKPEKQSPQHKLECLNYALSHPDIALKQLASDFGIGYSTLLKWAAKARSAAYCAEEGLSCMSVFDYMQAAEHYKTAADLYPLKVIASNSAYFDYLRNNAYAQYCAGDAQDDKSLLSSAIELLSMLAAQLHHAQHTEAWTYTQNDLGNAFVSLGKLKNDPMLLQRAIAAFRSVLKGIHREESPENWAQVQQNLGKALSMLASRRNDPLLMKAAIEAYREASDAGLLQHDED